MNDTVTLLDAAAVNMTWNRILILTILLRKTFIKYLLFITEITTVDDKVWKTAML